MHQPDSADLVDVHQHCHENRRELAASNICGCFHCRLVFTPRDIVAWIDPVNEPEQPGQTALCPGCGVDSVIGDQSGFPISNEFLHAMRGRWFS